VHLARTAAAAVIAIQLAACGSSPQQDEGVVVTPAPSIREDVEGGDEAGLERLGPVAAATASTRPPATQGGTRRDRFLVAVFDDAQALWQREFEQAGLQYEPARITLFRDSVESACGTQSASIGPFYCPADHGVYLDTRFFDALSRSVGVRLGDFAQAYVVAHEVGHHVQFNLGIIGRVAAADEQDGAGANARSVRVELQADCLAGIWKHATYRRGQIGEAEIADALRAAAVIGDDFQQRRATGTVRPETWTHGSSQQRQQWLTTGLESGDPSACDTFDPTRTP
jgi:uncharacterized protein